MFAATIQLHGGSPICWCVPRPASEGVKIQAITKTVAAASAENPELRRTPREARCGIATLHPAEAQSGVTGGGAEDPDALTILTGYRARVGEATKSIKINLAGIKNPPFDRPESDQGSRDR
jgi:hypothetical protein